MTGVFTKNFLSSKISSPISVQPRSTIPSDTLLSALKAASMRATASSPLGDFAKLPPELRVMIFELVLPEKQFVIESVLDINTIGVLPLSELPLAGASQAIRFEYLPILHRKGYFCLLRTRNDMSYAKR